MFSHYNPFFIKRLSLAVARGNKDSESSLFL